MVHWMSIRAGDRQAQRIGFIGLGAMGLPMARNLLKAGQGLVVQDPSPSGPAALASEYPDQVQVAPTEQSPAELVRAHAPLQAVITMLPSEPVVSDVYAGPKGIFSADAAPQGLVCLDASTIGPALARNLHDQGKQRGIAFVDAPVSGGVGGATAGTLTFMLGLDATQQAGLMQQAEAVLGPLGQRFVACGGPGLGQAAKICNNMLLGISMAGLCEVLLLGQKLGLEAGLLSSIINTSSGHCWSSERYNPVPGIMPGVPATKGYEGGFATRHMAKDLTLALRAAQETPGGANVLNMGALVQALYDSLAQSPQFAAKDFSVYYKYLQDASNINKPS